jgi:dephospho-CoA kinase
MSMRFKGFRSATVISAAKVAHAAESVLRFLRRTVRSCLPLPATAHSLAIVPFSTVYMLLVGLTGNIGSGKSTVAQLLSERGATIIDADVLARRAVEVGTPAYRAIVERWGTSILEPSGMLDRSALRRIVFSEPAELEQLNALVHPEVERMRLSLVQQARMRGDKLVVCDIPLLFERKMTDVFDRIVLVDAPRPVRLERMVRERGLKETEAMDMIVAQMPAELKRARADFVIDNVGTLTQLDARVAEVWAALAQAAELTASPAYEG